MNKSTISILVFALAAGFNVSMQVRAQVVPASDGTGTMVQTSTSSSGNTTIDITGGSLSQDGNNLFQSFEQFDIPNQTTANFISSPGIQNVIGRITGGSFSQIQGTISLTGGNSNLFLINPAGFFFRRWSERPEWLLCIHLKRPIV